MKKIIITFLSILIFTVLFQYSLNTNSSIVVGITSRYQVDLIENYLNEFVSIDSQIKIKYIGNEINDLDPFLQTYKNIKNELLTGSVDMVLNAEEDYILPLMDENIMCELNELVTKPNIPIDIKNFSGNRGQKIHYIPTELNNVRVMLVNRKLLTQLGLELPQERLSFEDFFQLVGKITTRIKENNMSDTYAVSLGSPIDEYIYDDIFKFVECVDNRKNLNLFLQYFAKTATLAKENSYRRSEIGYEYPLDFEFANGNIVLKIATAYELKVLEGKIEDQYLKNIAKKNIDYYVLPHPYFNGYDYTLGDIKVSCISSKSRRYKECMEIIQFLLSDQNAFNVINDKTPLSIGTGGVPVTLNSKLSKCS